MNLFSKPANVRIIGIMFNRDSVGFLMRFALILGVAFAVLFAVNAYIIGTEGQETAAPADINEQR